MADSVYRAKRPEVTESVAGSGRRTLLVVEDDKVGAQFAELNLTRGGYRVEVAGDVAAAMEILATTRIDLVLSDLYLPDMDGYQFFRRMRRENRYRAIPFIVVSSDTRLTTRLVGLEMGVDDFVAKPYEMAELKARIDASIRRLDASRAASQARRYNLAGDFTGMSFPDLINLLDQGRRTGTLSVVTPRAAAEFRIREGIVLYAGFGNLIGDEAFHGVLAEPQGQFEFAPGEVEPVPDAPPMTGNCTALLMEGARRMDTLARDPGPAAGVSVDAAAPAAAAASGGAAAVAAGGAGAPGGPGAPGVAGGPGDLVPAPTPDAMVALELVDGVSDPFALGELQLLSPESLRDFTSVTTWKERLHGLLVTDRETGVTAMAGLAAPLTDRQVLHMLRERVTTIGLVFSLRKERLVDLVLIDSDAPVALLDSLRRRPAYVIVAPRSGDFLSLGVESQVGLVTLLQKLQPVTLVGVGNPSVKQGLEELQARAGTSIPLRLVLKSLDEPGADLRDVILEAVSAWAEQAPPLGEMG